MNLEISLVLMILGIAITLFISNRIRVDLVGLLVLGGLALSGLVTPTQALSGFSNPAVVTVWAVLILSGGLARTGVASNIGRWDHAVIGVRLPRLIDIRISILDRKIAAGIIGKNIGPVRRIYIVRAC